MSALITIALLAGSSSLVQGTDGHLETPHLYVTGAFCSPVGCASNPRKTEHEIKFDRERSNLDLVSKDRLKMDWGIVLNCAVQRNRLKNCTQESDSTGSTQSLGVALKLIKSLRIDASDVPLESSGKRAIVSFTYAAGNCPYWQCSSTPAPPAQSAQ